MSYAIGKKMIIVIGGIKGGSGKTTLATNLVVIRALSGKKVLLVDADEQRSASDWAEHRESLGISTPWTTIQLTGASVRSQLQRMQNDYDEIIVDTGGRDTTSQRASLTIADVLIAPFQPRSLDIWTLGKLSSLLEEVRVVNPKLKAFAVINRADPQGTDNHDAMQLIKEAEHIKCIPITIGQRKAFANAASEGLGVVELKSHDKKAVLEINNLCDSLYDITKTLK